VERPSAAARPGLSKPLRRRASRVVNFEVHDCTHLLTAPRVRSTAPLSVYMCVRESEVTFVGATVQTQICAFACTHARTHAYPYPVYTHTHTCTATHAQPQTWHCSNGIAVDGLRKINGCYIEIEVLMEKPKRLQMSLIKAWAMQCSHLPPAARSGTDVLTLPPTTGFIALARASFSCSSWC